MQKHSFDKKTLDAAGQKLVKSQALPVAEIDRVVGDPFLLTRVKARIAGVEITHQKRSPALFLHPKTLALTVAACVAAIIGVVLLLKPGTSVDQIDRAGSQEPVVATAPPVKPPTEPIFVASKPENAVSASQPRVQRAVLRKPIIRQTNAKKPKAKPEAAQFYAVAGVSTDSEGGGRIIRIEMSRSSLFAHGINLPLENDDQRPIKADVLVGRDGSTRAIRLVED